ncbi:MAG: DUF4442 domain-containing protein [Verrucomicrobiota bacterium]
MDVLSLQLNAHLGLERCNDPQLLTLPFADHLTNHMNSMHATALFGLAEAASGEFLIRGRGDRKDIGGVVRRATSKYSAAATNQVTATSKTNPDTLVNAIEAVDAKGRALVAVEIELTEKSGNKIGQFTFDWLLAKT